MDLVISDVNMANRDGIFLLRELRRRPAYCYAPPLTLTTEATVVAPERLDTRRAAAPAFLVRGVLDR